MKETAIILTSGKFNSRNAKTAFGLIRTSEQYNILAVIDQNTAGQDAGEIVDGKAVDIPIHASIKDFINAHSSKLKNAPEESGRGRPPGRPRSHTRAPPHIATPRKPMPCYAGFAAALQYTHHQYTVYSIIRRRPPKFDNSARTDTQRQTPGNRIHA